MKAPTTWCIAVMSEESHTSVWRYAARRGLGPTYMNGGTNWQRGNLVDTRTWDGRDNQCRSDTSTYFQCDYPSESVPHAQR